MPLYKFNRNEDEPITKVPREDYYNTIAQRLTESDLAAMKKHINDYVDACDNFQSSWIPSKATEVFKPVLEIAGDLDQSSMWIGLLIWHVMMDRENDEWFFRMADTDDEVKGTHYWRRGLVD